MVNPKEDSVIITTVMAMVLMLYHAFLRASQLEETSSTIPVYRGGSQVSKSLDNLSKVILLEGGVKLLA